MGPLFCSHGPRVLVGQLAALNLVSIAHFPSRCWSSRGPQHRRLLTLRGMKASAHSADMIPADVGPIRDIYKVPLLKCESTAFAGEVPGIATVTFFKGDKDKGIRYVDGRLREIVQSNSWLAGNLKRTKDHPNLQLSYPSPGSPISDEVMAELLRVDPAGVHIHDRMQFENVCSELDKASCFLPAAKALVNTPCRVLKATIVSSSEGESEGFALVFCLSHAVADGFTYYRILNMLSRDEKVESLSVVRKLDREPEMENSVGSRDYGFLFSATHMCNMVLYMLFGKKAKSYAFYVDNARVNEIKASTNKDGVDFVSTNDILTASFANLIGARICMMAVNFRSRLRSFDTYDAGNYEGALLYDSTSYSTPSHIRKTLSKGPPFETRGEQMPGFFEGSLSRISMVSNWATFAKDLKVEACDQELHIPAGPPGKAPWGEVAIIFRPNSKGLGMIFGTVSLDSETLQSKLPLGSPISSHLFQS